MSSQTFKENTWCILSWSHREGHCCHCLLVGENIQGGEEYITLARPQNKMTVGLIR